jgi:DNA-binding NarL/FixJ family response regulator
LIPAQIIRYGFEEAELKDDPYGRMSLVTQVLSHSADLFNRRAKTEERKERSMSISFSSALSAATAAATNSTSAPPPQPAPQPVNNSDDTVKLTEAEQVFNLYTQGQTVSEIATNLNLTVSDVNSYLGLTSSS